MAAAKIDFWFTMGSTYSFLSVMRLAELERSTGITFRWRPFHLLVILQEMKHVPFADKPTKLVYMWRDIERRAALYGIPARLPAPYPAKHSVAAMHQSATVDTRLTMDMGMAIGGCIARPTLTMAGRVVMAVGTEVGATAGEPV